ncbi:early endoderm-specific nuclear factor L homeolog [Xenopus laevis]|uniref:Early endoderm-specific nuclear factor L homeolog n=1 Tax=Xenopus laevis TaxID=8355 RepID=Q9PTU9_XENLA|nr:early endoderm-specific nuclear factor L homeolog [Xenopus laevis]BAA88673.1 early endoderm-specific nuclear factor Xenf [Xenopus laevis]
MASSRSQNRHALACKFCLRIQESLSVHLRRSCKKGAKPEEIDRLVSEARVNMRQILKGLSVVEYDELDCKESDPQDFFVQFLERNGCYIRGKPVQPTSSPILKTFDAMEQQQQGLKSKAVENRNIVSSTEENNKEEPKLKSITEADVGSPDLSTNGVQEDAIVKEEEEMETRGPDQGQDFDCGESEELQRRMKEAGMYRIHPIDSKVLVVFQKYIKSLSDDAKRTRGVAKIARFLYFMDPSEPSLNFLLNLPKTHDFFEKLQSLGNKTTTLLDYLDHIEWFVIFVLFQNDHQLYDRCQHFLYVLQNYIYKRLRRRLAEEAREKEYRLLFGEAESPEELNWILLYRQKAIDDMVARAELMKLLTSYPQPSTSSRYDDDSTITPAIKKPGELAQKGVKAVPKESKDDTYNKFKEVYPLNLDSNPPKLKKGLAFSAVHGQYCYDKWRKAQNKMRVDQITGHFKTRFPREEEVKRIIRCKGWKLNLPRLKDIMDNCKAQLR